VGVRNEGVELQPATCTITNPKLYINTLPFKGNENKIKYSNYINNINCYEEDQVIQQMLGNSEWHNVSHQKD
jgi:hypothetical protein